MELSRQLHASAVLLRRKHPPVPTDQEELGRPQSRSGRSEEGCSVFSLPRNEPHFFGCPARSLVTIPIKLSSPERLDRTWGHSRLLFNGYWERFPYLKRQWRESHYSPISLHVVHRDNGAL
jgi:hypothetical protein